MPVLAPNFVLHAYRPFRKIVNVGTLHQSALNGALSKLKASTFTWKNPSFTYSATGTATTVDGGTQIPATHVGAALTIYDATGAVI